MTAFDIALLLDFQSSTAPVCTPVLIYLAARECEYVFVVGPLKDKLSTDISMKQLAY